MLKIKDVVTTDARRGYGYVGDIQKVAVDSNGVDIALVRKMGSQRRCWHRVDSLVPLTWLND